MYSGDDQRHLDDGINADFSVGFAMSWMDDGIVCLDFMLAQRRVGTASLDTGFSVVDIGQCYGFASAVDSMVFGDWSSRRLLVGVARKCRGFCSTPTGRFSGEEIHETGVGCCDSIFSIDLESRIFES